jgi:hypothetical protein
MLCDRLVRTPWLPVLFASGGVRLLARWDTLKTRTSTGFHLPPEPSPFNALSCHNHTTFIASKAVGSVQISCLKKQSRELLQDL